MNMKFGDILEQNQETIDGVTTIETSRFLGMDGTKFVSAKIKTTIKDGVQKDEVMTVSVSLSENDIKMRKERNLIGMVCYD
jgi:hypothetical protein